MKFEKSNIIRTIFFVFIGSLVVFGGIGVYFLFGLGLILMGQDYLIGSIALGCIMLLGFYFIGKDVCIYVSSLIHTMSNAGPSNKM